MARAAFALQRKPVALSARVREVLGTRLQYDASQARDACVAAAEELLTRLLSAQKTGRESALDLLAADALVTYAAESAAESADTLEGWAGNAMTRISAIGAQYAAATP